MLRIAVGFLLLGFLLAGCGTVVAGQPSAAASTSGDSVPADSAPADSASATSTPLSSVPAPAPAPVPALPGAVDGATVAECFDGTCRIAVSGPVTFPVDLRFGVTTMSVAAIGPDSVTVNADGPGITLQVVVGPGGTGWLNNIRVRLLAINGHTAILDLSAA